MAAGNIVESGNFAFADTSIEGVKVVDVKSYGDARGYFVETYKRPDFVVGGIDVEFVQDDQSSSTKGVLRGLCFGRKSRLLIINVCPNWRDNSHDRFITKKIIFTGGVGYIGLSFVHCVVANESDVNIGVLDRLANAGSLADIDDVPGNRPPISHGDICNNALLGEAVSERDVVDYCIVKFHDASSITNSKPFLNANVGCTHLMIKVYCKNESGLMRNEPISGTDLLMHRIPRATLFYKDDNCLAFSSLSTRLKVVQSSLSPFFKCD